MVDLWENEVEELPRSRIDPMQILKDHQDRLLTAQPFKLSQQRRKGALLFALWAQLEWCETIAAGQGQQLHQQRNVAGLGRPREQRRQLVKDTISHVLRNEASKATHRLCDALLIGRNDLAESSGSMRAESAVEPTKSENITVTRRRSARSSGETTVGALVAAPDDGVASASVRRAAMASRSLRRWPTTETPRSFRSSAVRFGRTVSSISLSRKAASYRPRPRLRSQTTMSMTATQIQGWRTSSSCPEKVSREVSVHCAAGGRRSDIYSRDLIQSVPGTPKPGVCVAAGHRRTASSSDFTPLFVFS